MQQVDMSIYHVFQSCHGGEEEEGDDGGDEGVTGSSIQVV